MADEADEVEVEDAVEDVEEAALPKSLQLVKAPHQSQLHQDLWLRRQKVLPLLLPRQRDPKVMAVNLPAQYSLLWS